MALIQRQYTTPSSERVELPFGTSTCPNCHRGDLTVSEGQTINTAEGGPRVMGCDFCGWTMVSNLYGDDNHAPGPGPHRQ